jgi:hypothetical protein
MMISEILIILDVQEPYLDDLTEEDRERVVDEVSRQIIIAREDGYGIVIAEFNVKEKGETEQAILDLVENYDKVLQFERSSLNGADEILAVIRQQRFPEGPIRLCGLYGDGAIKDTAESILYLTNYQTKVKIVEAACGCVNHLYSDMDCLRWMEGVDIEIV